MALIVQKYGGTSLGDRACINRVADTVTRARQTGDQVVVVVSAMSGETDRLVNLARGISTNPSSREYAVLVSTGEQVSMALLSMALHERGVEARSYTGGQARIKTDSAHHKARINEVDAEPIRKDLEAGFVAVVAGFQGIDPEGNITTLGRGGSDTTAVALAAALKADECQIYTDVDGVYTADPRVVPAAQRLDKITFEEMFELASLGAKVLQNRAVELAGKFEVPLRVLSSFEDGPGTLISFEEKDVEKPVVSGLAFNRNEAKLTLMSVPDVPGVAAKILGPINDANIAVDMVIQNIAADGTTDFTFTLHRDDYQQALQLLDTVMKELDAGRIIGDNKIAKLSVVGVGMRSHSGIAQQMFRSLGQEGINIQMITTSEIKVSVVIDEKYLELGLRALHTAFGLDNHTQEEFDPKPEGK